MAWGSERRRRFSAWSNATLLHPLRFPHPEELVRIEDDLPGAGVTDAGISVPEFKDLQRSGIFQYAVLQIFGSVNLTGASQPSRAQYEGVSPAYFAMLGVKPELGPRSIPGSNSGVHAGER
jgi:hypothetical protein